VRRRPTRTPVERLKKLFTAKRPHRCKKCGWYGWLEVSEHPAHVQTWTVEREPPDLGAVDDALGTESRRVRSDSR
jgi:hypothetical protein